MLQQMMLRCQGMSAHDVGAMYGQMHLMTMSVDGDGWTAMSTGKNDGGDEKRKRKRLTANDGGSMVWRQAASAACANAISTTAAASATAAANAVPLDANVRCQMMSMSTVNGANV